MNALVEYHKVFPAHQSVAVINTHFQLHLAIVCSVCSLQVVRDFPHWQEVVNEVCA